MKKNTSLNKIIIFSITFGISAFFTTNIIFAQSTPTRVPANSQIQRTEAKKALCDRVTKRVEELVMRMQTSHDKRQEALNKAETSIAKAITKAEELRYNTSKVKSNLTNLKEMRTKIAEDHSNAIAALEATKEIQCELRTGNFREKAQVAKTKADSYRKNVKQELAKELRALKESLKELKLQKSSTVNN